MQLSEQEQKEEVARLAHQYYEQRRAHREAKNALDTIKKELMAAINGDELDDAIIESGGYRVKLSTFARTCLKSKDDLIRELSPFVTDEGGNITYTPEGNPVLDLKAGAAAYANLQQTTHVKRLVVNQTIFPEEENDA